MSAEFEVVVVGAGIAGGALAAAMARQGRHVLLLEKSLQHVDRVRGEYLQPWGVAELQRLGLFERLMAAGANVMSRSVAYDETIGPAEAEARARFYDKMIDGVPGALGYSHPGFCDLLDEAAVEAGATFLRGVGDIEVEAGSPPRIAFSHDRRRRDLRPALIVGADGRGSRVARQAGMVPSRDEPHHIFAGLLVEGVPAWPQDTFTVGTEGNYLFFVTPQGGDRLRLYLGFGYSDISRFAGAGGPQRFLDAFSFSSLPPAVCFQDGRPAGPVHAYSNEDSWCDTVVAPGVVLVGDAAGFNDPLAGQGLSIALRDARMVAELLAPPEGLDVARLAPYVEERGERMRRLRIAGSALARLHVEFGPEPRERRRRVNERVATQPLLGALFGAFFLGPEWPPASAFAPARIARLLA